MEPGSKTCYSCGNDVDPEVARMLAYAVDQVMESDFMSDEISERFLGMAVHCTGASEVLLDEDDDRTEGGIVLCGKCIERDFMKAVKG